MTLRQKSTLSRGIIAETAVIAHLTRYGFNVSLPVSGHSPYDLIVEDRNYTLRRVQVKFVSARNDRVTMYMLRIHTNSQGAQAKPINLRTFDAFAIYCPQTEEIYYIPKWEMVANKASFSLRLGLGPGEPSRERRKTKTGKPYRRRTIPLKRIAKNYTDPALIFSRKPDKRTQNPEISPNRRNRKKVK